MAEKSYFYDSTTDDQRIYQAADFARFHAQIIGNGVSNTDTLPDLEVTAKDNMEIALGAGYMFADGYMYENNSTMTLKHDIADSINDRIDRIIIQFNSDPTERRIFAYIKKGVPTISPVPPTLRRDNYIHEMSVAQVRVIAGKSYIEQTQITDERTDDSASGYIPLHNIYRGLQINELGMVTMPNQSFIKTKNVTPQPFPDGVTLSNAFPLKFGTTEKDKQGEIISATEFKAKADGVYMFWVEAGFGVSSFNSGGRIIAYVFVNDEESFPLGIHTFQSGGDRYMMFSGFDDLKKDDVIKFMITTNNIGSDVKTELTRVRVVKTA